ncbi:MAG TPA: glycosyltransferase family 2 protein [Tepidisphaeraceae bacterium]|nr:glycosyltransferase family 2 protein [Tepidisphaeraceae bacterium]
MHSSPAGRTTAAPTPRTLTALPVYNEVRHVTAVLDEVVRSGLPGDQGDILVVDDGSNDGTRELLARRRDLVVVTHPQNRGYGAALRTAFDYAIAHGYDFLVTIDCDGQHEPQRIRELVQGCRDVDIASGSRYLGVDIPVGLAPADRRRINVTVTDELNCRLGLKLTDAFCGFKAYRVEALKKLQLTDNGYAMPLELWVQAAFHGLRVVEVAVPLIYLDEKRSFGGALDDSATRLAYYHSVIEKAVKACRAQCAAHPLPAFSCLPSPFQGCCS